MTRQGCPLLGHSHSQEGKVVDRHSPTHDSSFFHIKSTKFRFVPCKHLLMDRNCLDRQHLDHSHIQEEDICTGHTLCLLDKIRQDNQLLDRSHNQEEMVADKDNPTQ